MNKYTVQGIVGEGAYGVVLKCINKVRLKTAWNVRLSDTLHPASGCAIAAPLHPSFHAPFHSFCGVSVSLTA